jgi:predicted nucleic acid-binding protein
MNIYLPDTNVFSKIFKGDAALKSFVESLDSAICTTVYIENIQGSKSNQEKRFIKNYLNNFSFILTNEDVAKRAIDLIDAYSNSHGLLLADALIAATALENDLTVLTCNIGDFQFIKDLNCEKPPL